MISQFHSDVFRWINDLGKQYSVLNPAVVFLAEYMVYILAVSMMIYWITRSVQNRMMVLQGGISFIIAEILGKTAGLLYYHNQPFAVLPEVNQLIEHEIDNSFPSDHTILFFSICMSYWLFRKKSGWLWLVLACCVAVSRVWVGVHYPVDIAVGACLGILSAVFVYWIESKSALLAKCLGWYVQIEQRILPSRSKSKDA